MAFRFALIQLHSFFKHYCEKFIDYEPLFQGLPSQYILSLTSTDIFFLMTSMMVVDPMINTTVYAFKDQVRLKWNNKFNIMQQVTVIK